MINCSSAAMFCSPVESDAGIYPAGTGTFCFAGSRRKFIHWATTSRSSQGMDPPPRLVSSGEQIRSCGKLQYHHVSHSCADGEKREDDNVLDQMNEKRPDAAARFHHATRTNPAGESRHDNAERPGRLPVIMPEPKQNGGEQNCFARRKQPAKMREKNAAKLKFFTRRVERGDGETPGKSPDDAAAEIKIRMDRQVEIGREHQGENEDEGRAEPGPRHRFS